MSKISKIDTDGTKPLLSIGELGYDNYTAGGDVGRVYVGDGGSNIPLAKRVEVDNHTTNENNPHRVTKAQIGLDSVDNTADSAKVVASAAKLTTARTINGVSFDGTNDISVGLAGELVVTELTAATTLNIGTEGYGNYIVVSGSTDLVSFGTAYAAGVKRTIKFTNPLYIRNSTNLVCPRNADLTILPGMCIDVVAETTTIWRITAVMQNAISTEEIGRLSGVTSNVQAQLNDKLSTVGKAANSDKLDGFDSSEFVKKVETSNLIQNITGLYELNLDNKSILACDGANLLLGGGLTGVLAYKGEPIFHSGNCEILKSGVGYQKLANGLIVQWGFNNSSAAQVAVGFHVTFPTYCVYANAVLVGSTAGYASLADAPTNTGTVFNKSVGYGIRWIAIGY